LIPWLSLGFDDVISPKSNNQLFSIALDMLYKDLLLIANISLSVI
jgi:hypothetical protein